MRRNAVLGLLAAAALAALTALPSFAGIRGKAVTVNALTINGRSIGSGEWKVSSPTLRSEKGYLAYDPTGKSTEVTFQQKAGPGTSWAFVNMKSFEHYVPMGMRGGWYISEEQTGYTMKLQATEGPLKGWYLRRERDGSLVLIEERRLSSTLELLEKTVEIKGR